MEKKNHYANTASFPLPMSGFLHKTPLFASILAATLSISCSKGITLPEPKDGVTIIRGENRAVIQGFCEDSSHTVWMMSNYDGLFRAKGQTLLQYTADPDDAGSLSSNTVNALRISPSGAAWVGTSGGVNRFDPSTDSFVYYGVDSYDSYIRDILFDSEGEVYARSWRSLFKLDKESHNFKSVLDFRAVTKDEIVPLFDCEGNLWIRYSSTLMRFDRAFETLFSKEMGSAPLGIVPLTGKLLVLGGDGHLHALSTSDGEDSPLPQGLKELSSLEVSGMFPSGKYISFSSENGRAIYDIREDELHSEWGGSSIFDPLFAGSSGEAFLLDCSSNLWFPVRGGGFRVQRTSRIEDLPHSKLLAVLRDESWSSPASDGKYFWAILSGNRLLSYDLGKDEVTDISSLYSLTGSTHATRKIIPSGEGQLITGGFGRTDNGIYHLGMGPEGHPRLLHRYLSTEPINGALDGNGEVWALAVGSKLYHTPKPDADSPVDITLSPVEGIPPVNEISYFPEVITLKDGRILFGATNNNPIILDPEGPSVEEIPVRNERFQVFWNVLFQDSRGDIWLGSRSIGLFRYILSEKRIEAIPGTEQTGTASIFEDKNGDILFLNSDRSILRWSHTDGETHLLWSDEEQLTPKRWLLVLEDSGPYVYDGQGLFSFDEKNADLSHMPVTVILSNNGKEIKSFPMDEENNTIRLKFLSIREIPELMISMGLSGLGHSYDYHLSINRSSEMTRVSSQSPEISLHSLHYGRNRIRFHFKNPEGKESSPVYTVILTVPRPLWFWLAIFGAIGLAAGLALTFRSLLRKKEEAQRERREREMQERLNTQNIDSFANISHEFRSPLTLINAALNSLDGEDSPEERKKAIMMARRNVSRMMNLTSQMMDFNRLDHGKLTLSVTPCDLSAQIRKTWEAFVVGADQKNVDWRLNGCEEVHEGWADTDKLEKILWNLCSNALKFTPPGGAVDVDCSFLEGSLTVKVLDTGIGLDEERIAHLFERFNQSPEARQVGGTGIGLFYTKSLVELHHGHISAENRSDGPGSVFTFSIPYSESSFSDEEKDGEVDLRSMTVKQSESTSLDVAEVEPSKKDAKLPSVLLIDDDYDLVHYLKSLLSKDYNVSFRFDAMSGYELLKKENPDVVICDVMMMGVSGLELCKMVKENLDLCHIPVIMLTARSSVADQVNALDVGADAYVTKPFEPDYLTALVRSTVENRSRLRQILSSSTETLDREVSDSLSPRDRQFMDKVYALLEKSLSTGEIEIESIASELGVSRSKFFYKIKALTGQTPGDFFTLYKLNRAAELLREDRYKISAIASMVGFSSSSHFASLFKKRFGMLPSQYVQAHGGEERSEGE